MSRDVPGVFVKTGTSGERLDQEVAGLRWLAEAEAEGGTRIVRVLGVTANRLELEYVSEASATRDSARAFGASLARTHAAGAGWFGCAPSGWPGGETIGRSRQPYVLQAADAPATWGSFYAEWRVSVFARRMREQGLIDAAEAHTYDRLCDRLSAGDFDAPQPGLVRSVGARVHGDLWAGNVLWTGGTTGAVLIDPLARGDHAESDLGMLSLFGLARLADVYDGYDQASPLAHGWRDRLSLHALSPLMFHALLFGGGYGAQAIAVARHYA